MFASAYASLCVERTGKAESMPTYAEALARLKQYSDYGPEALAAWVEESEIVESPPNTIALR